MKILNAFTKCFFGCCWHDLCLEESVVGFLFCFLILLALYHPSVLAYEINSVSEYKMSGSSQLAKLVQGQSDESTLLTGCLLTSPGRYPDSKHHQDCEAVIFFLFSFFDHLSYAAKSGRI